MRGIPKVFGTVQDVENSMAEDVKATKARLRQLLEGRFAWFAVRMLAADEEGQADETHRVMIHSGGMGPDGQEGPDERWQYALQEDSNAVMFQIGLTVEKINEYLAMPEPQEEE